MFQLKHETPLALPLMLKERQPIATVGDAAGFFCNPLRGAARNLRTSRTHAVLAIVPDISNTFFSQVLRGISDTLRRHGYSLVIADTANDPERERDHAEFIQSGRVDGVLLLNGRLLSPHNTRRRQDVPTVSLCERIAGGYRDAGQHAGAVSGAA